VLFTVFISGLTFSYFVVLNHIYNFLTDAVRYSFNQTVGQGAI